MAPGTPAPSTLATSPTTPRRTSGTYWDEATEVFVHGGANRLWRHFCDRVYEELIRRWLGGLRFERALKTDLFDEAAGDGLAPILGDLASEVHGIDISRAVASAASRRSPSLLAAVSDTRTLCYRDATFDLVLSNSTLDHFPASEDITRALAEIHRVTAPGGRLLITLDNPVNPVVGARAVAPFDLLARLRLVPYFVGATLSQRSLRRALVEAGYEILAERTLMHAPRLPAMLLCRLVEATGGERARQQALRFLESCEVFGRLPSRQLSAYYVAALARRPSSPVGPSAPPGASPGKLASGIP